MSVENLEELLLAELKDLYSAEKQITKALPKLVKAASSQELKDGFQEHLRQTEGHVQRLEQVAEMLGKKLTGKTCEGMKGLLEEGDEMASTTEKGTAVRDAGLITAAQRVEHYEIAGYGGVIAYCKVLGYNDAVNLLHQTLEEEKETDAKLTQLATTLNRKAQQGAREEIRQGSRRAA